MAKVSFPARCAVAVVCGEHLISQVYPAAVPVEVFIDDVVDLLNSELLRRGMAALDPGIAYQLNRVNGAKLDVSRTLDELGVEDGTTLVLVAASEREQFEPQYESLSTGLARVGKRLFQPVTATTAVYTGIAIFAMVAVTLLGLAVRNRMDSDGLIPALVTGIGGLLVAGGASVLWQWWPDRRDLLSGVGWIALPLLAFSAGAVAPGALGAAHAFIAGLSLAVLAWSLVTLTRRHHTASAAVITLCALGGLAAAARMWRPVHGQWLGMCALIALLFLLSVAPTFALWAARIRPPHFGSITGRDLFRRSDGQPADTVSPVEEDAAADELHSDTTPRGTELASAARRANAVLTGLCIAAGVTLPVAAWFTLMPGQPLGIAAVILVGLLVLIFISRGRTYADKRQAVSLVLGAAAGLCTGVAKYVLHWPADSGAPLLWGTVLLIGFAALGMLAAILVPGTRFTPLVRMVTEWLELAAIVVALPLAAWIGGLFTWVRMR